VTAGTAEVVIGTKLFRPGLRQQTVERKRLYDVLREGRTLPLTLVVAPAGWGKSTIVTDWLARDDVTARPLLSECDVLRLLVRTEGWAAGLQLAARGCATGRTVRTSSSGSPARTGTSSTTSARRCWPASSSRSASSCW
jgi:ATP/maltotriose-dependent transcriptional regulator MalT